MDTFFWWTGVIFWTSIGAWISVAICCVLVVSVQYSLEKKEWREDD